MKNLSQRTRIIITILVVFLVTGLIFIALFSLNKSDNKNQFGDYIKIQNYNNIINNLSPTMKDSIQTSLYNTVKINLSNEINSSSINDAYIRTPVTPQSFDTKKQIYSGTFLIDMESIKQTYQVQYSYSTSNIIDVGGSPVIIMCPTKDQLRYGEFECKDLLSKQSVPDDDILQYLPYQGYSFKISPDSTSGELVLNITLMIASSDLGPTVATRAAAVTFYKNEVKNWFETKNIEPSKYVLKYNYTDNGDYLGDSVFQ